MPIEAYIEDKRATIGNSIGESDLRYFVEGNLEVVSRVLSSVNGKRFAEKAASHVKLSLTKKTRQV